MTTHAPCTTRPAATKIRALRALALPTVLATLGAALFAAPAPAAPEPVGNATFPGSNFRCSSGQKTFLKAAWQEAYVYTASAKAIIDKIAAQPNDSEERKLWEQGFAGYGKPGAWQLTSSPQRYFGSYDHARLMRIKQALDIARSRYEGKTMYLITCSKICAAKKSTSAHHAVRGRIVTCTVFWKRANEKGVKYADRLATSAFTLTHEVMHHIFVTVNGVKAAIGDYHGDGVGGHPDRKYYGVDNVTYLAQKATGWAVRNNDTYAYFAWIAGRS